MLALWIVLGVIGGLIVIYAMHILFLVITASFIEEKEYDKDSKFYRFLLVFNTFGALQFGRVKRHLSGMEKLKDVNGRVLLVFNHRSNWDPLILWWHLRKYEPAFITKPENYKVPVFGKFIRKCCFRAIDRSNPKSSYKTFISAAELIKKDEVSIAVSPEGTRSKECVLLPFHDGVFKIAKMAEVPIVVVTLNGQEKIHKNYFFKRTHVYMDIADVIPVDYVTTHTTHEIGALIREEMISSLEISDKKLKK